MNMIVDSSLATLRPEHAEKPAQPREAHVLALAELHEQPDATAPLVAGAMPNPLHHVKARLKVCVGEVELTIGELLSAREHQVFVLDRSVDEPVDLVLEGSVVARGQLVAVDDQFALRITELALP